MALPADVERRLARAVGAYLKATPANELPRRLQPLRDFTPQALAAQRKRLLSAAEDEGLRARIIEWLDADKHRLSAADERLLRAFAERPDGWEERLASAPGAHPARKSDDGPRTDDRLEREKEKTRRAREEAQRARADIVELKRKAVAEAQAARREIDELRKRVARLEDEAANAARARTAASDRLAKEQRKTRRAVDEARADKEKARAALKAERRRGKELEAKVAKLESDIAGLRRARTPAATKTTRPRRAMPARRRPLHVPKGRPGDDPETLDEWLTEDGVRLLIDGYNVTKALGGYGRLSLEKQRERLIEDVAKFARRRRVGATIVFDGAVLPPGAARRSRASVDVEYSKPPENADDHLIARLSQMPPDPVVVVTNDRELQGRARRLGATIASSNQLLTLIRP